MAKQKLDKEEIEWNTFRLIGITASINDFTLCFHLNDILQADFQRIDDHQLLLKNRDKAIAFHSFQWHDEVSDLQLLLVSNRSGNDLLFPEIAGVDFILKIVGNMDILELLKSLKSIEQVQTALQLQPIKLKNAIEKSGLFF